MNIERRGFLKGLLAAPVIIKAGSLMKLAKPIIPTLWGDGIHDDAQALEYYLNHVPDFQIHEGTFLIESPLRLFKASYATLIRSTVKAGKKFSGNEVLHVFKTANQKLLDSTFLGPEGKVIESIARFSEYQLSEIGIIEKIP